MMIGQNVQAVKTLKQGLIKSLSIGTIRHVINGDMGAVYVVEFQKAFSICTWDEITDNIILENGVIINEQKDLLLQEKSKLVQCKKCKLVHSIGERKPVKKMFGWQTVYVCPNCKNYHYYDIESNTPPTPFLATKKG